MASELAKRKSSLSMPGCVAESAPVSRRSRGSSKRRRRHRELPMPMRKADHHESFRCASRSTDRFYAPSVDYSASCAVPVMLSWRKPQPLQTIRTTGQRSPEQMIESNGSVTQPIRPNNQTMHRRASEPKLKSGSQRCELSATAREKAGGKNDGDRSDCERSNLALLRSSVAHCANHPTKPTRRTIAVVTCARLAAR